LDEIESDVRLWRAVFDQAVADFLTESTEKRDLKNKEAAKVWLRGNTKDFYDVCYLACIEPKDVMKFLFEIINEDDLYE
jgi:hypothetical protein